jgi:Flp pilus assembly protein TadD
VKFCLIGIAVSLLVRPCLEAQNPGDSADPLMRVNQEKLAEMARRFDLDTGKYEAPDPSLPQSIQDSVVSVRSLQHQVDKRARKLEDRGMREYSRHHYEEALPLFREAAMIDPASTNLQNNLGVVYSALGDDKGAEQAFELALKADPYSAVSMSNLAAAAFNTNQYELAEVTARRALHMSPLLVEARVTLAFAEIAQGRWTDEARNFLEENRARVPEAQTLLHSWPQAGDKGSAAKPHVFVQGAGRGVSTPLVR